MADTITSKSTLQNVFEFADGDTRTVNIDDPNDNISASDVQAWAAYAVEHQILLGDKGGAALTGLKSSKKIDATATKMNFNI